MYYYQLAQPVRNAASAANDLPSIPVQILRAKCLHPSENPLSNDESRGAQLLRATRGYAVPQQHSEEIVTAGNQ
jgi:hypothetical protein